MNRKILPYALIAILVACYFIYPDEIVESARKPSEKARNTIPSQERNQIRETPEEQKQSHTDRLWTEMWDSKRVRRILDSRPSSARLFVAGYLLSGDLAFLEEAMLKFPDDPLPFLKYGAVSSGSLESRLAALNKLSIIEPANCAANLLKAAALAKENRGNEAIAELGESFKKRDYNTHSIDAVSGVREMALADGLSTEDANTKAMSQLWGNEVYQRSVGLIRALPGIAKDGGADLLASLGAGAGIKLAQSTDSPMDSYVSIQMEHAALSLVPPDTEYGATGISVKERLAILDKEEDMWKETQKLVIEELNASDAITKQLYMENYVSRGVIEANRLLLEKKTR